MFPKLSVVAAALCLLQVVSVYASQPNGEFCGGNRQSPIDLVTSSVTYTKQQGLYWGSGFFEEPLTQDVTVDNHTVVITSTFWQTPYIAGGPLQACYKLHSIHFHWSTTNDRGSEHTLNGLSYPMEMHVVMTKGNLTMDEAKADPKGIAVIGYFIDVLPEYLERRKPKNPFSILAKTMKRIQFVNRPKQMLTKFSINNLAIPFQFNFLTYQGSLTTGDCNEVVTWIISPNVLKISNKQLSMFRSLAPRRLIANASNYRQVQPLNGRTVYFAKGRRNIFDKAI
ncbi:carbonic anhydrase 7-like isoform X2 [Atheta coriaria]|uniref:carbonic anhydrase 7-like isoform X2 n=1 Tax=Dalotia coriaria TaxID=877792 RepID=UPI0031F36BD7